MYAEKTVFYSDWGHDTSEEFAESSELIHLTQSMYKQYIYTITCYWRDTLAYCTIDI